MNHRSICALGIWLVSLAPGQAAYPLEEWNEQAPLPTFRELQDLAHDGKQFILLDGDSAGRALVSEDGEDFVWQKLNLPEPLIPTRILHANGSYVLIASGRIWHRSHWGAEWVEAVGAGDSLAEVRAVGNKFWAWSEGKLAPGPKLGGRPIWKNSTLYRSEDGKAWVPVDLNLEEDARLSLFDLIHAKGRFWLGGSNFNSPAGFWSSLDGIAWIQVEGLRGGVSALCEGAGRIVAACSNGMMAVSEDGTAWSTKHHPFSSGSIGNEAGSWPTYHSCRQISHLNGAYQALFGDGMSTHVLAESKDGIDWKYSTLRGDPHPGYREAIGGIDGKPMIILVPVEGASPGSPSSLGGPNLTPADKSSLKFNAYDVSKARQIGDKLYFLGKQGKLWGASGSGKGFRSVLPRLPWDWTTISASDSKVVVAGNGGHLAWSDDAVSFHYQPIPEAAEITDSVWASELGLFVMVGGESGFGRAWTSKDGKAWKTEPLPGFTNQATGITWDGSKFIACGEKGQLATSVDGASWRLMESSIAESLSAIRWADGTFVATSTEGLIFSSSDAKSWNSRRVGREKRGYEQIEFGNGVWVLGDLDFQLPCIWSENLEEWRSSSGRTGYRVLHAFGNFISTDGRYLMSSSDGNLWQLHYDSYTPRSGHYFYEGFQAAARFRDRVVFAGDNGLIGTSGAWTDHFAEWRREHFDAAELAAVATSGPEADPDNDGWPNALEYALDFDPKVVDRYESRHVRFDKEQGGYYFTSDSGANAGIQIQVPTGKKKPGVVVWLERSTDMVRWTRDGMQISESMSETGDPRLIINFPNEDAPRQSVRMRWKIVKP